MICAEARDFQTGFQCFGLGKLTCKCSLKPYETLQAKHKLIEKPCLENHKMTVHIRSHKTPKVNFLIFF